MMSERVEPPRFPGPDAPTCTVISQQEPMLAPGLYAGIPADEYRRWRAASQSILRVLRDKTPAHVKQMLDDPPEPTPAQRLGEAVHMAVLQPDLFHSLYVAEPRIDRRTKAGRQAWEEFLAEHGGKTVLTEDEWRQCLAIRDAVASHPTASKLIGGEAELSAIWRDPDVGVLCKGRFDAVNEDIGAITDLKTTLDASPSGFSRTLFVQKYYLQAAHYLCGARSLGINAEYFVFIAVEKEPPYAVAVYHLQDDAIRAGAEELKPLLELYARCEQTGVWPGYEERAVEVGLPRWAWAQIDERMWSP